MDDYALYGHSLFETLIARDGRYRDLDRHFQRLGTAAAQVLLQPPDRAAFARALREAVPAEGAWVVRFTLLQQGGRWAANPAFKTKSHVWVKPYAGDSRPSLALHLSEHRFPCNDPWRQLKSGARLGYQIVGRLAKQAGYDDGLIVDQKGFILEAGTANLCFLRADGSWITPPLASGLLPGTVRQRLLEQSKVAEAAIKLEELPRFRAVVTTNAVSGPKPVRAVMTQRFNTEAAANWIAGLPEPETTTLDQFEAGTHNPAHTD
ncbi:aminotransferase class IV [Acanthopleuribacter pedis]|uniref:branched-chain-amino-acid transaminase n=1 Tax=Acanthopleuribacter pedis TaxID=442870 RepID=A0A8J7QGZ4_9BACT|nr:aminotransferase class IV [Acanthopleuribacter pedis]MBO1320171.1 aminotransferase class IV [Acanthopleuribacter pedis]